MTLGNMRDLGVQRLGATCLIDACRHQGLINVSSYPADTEVPWFSNKVGRAVATSTCGRIGKSNPSGKASRANIGDDYAYFGQR